MELKYKKSADPIELNNEHLKVAYLMLVRIILGTSNLGLYVYDNIFRQERKWKG